LEGSSTNGLRQELLASLPAVGPDHPVQLALREAYVHKVLLIIEHFPQNLAALIAQHPNDIEKYLSEWLRTFKAALELSRWAYPGGRMLSKDAAIREAERQMKQGLPLADASEYMIAWQKRPPGRPATLRPWAIEAFELRMKSTQLWPWRKVVEKLCPCGNVNHSKACQQNFEAEVRKLKSILRKYGIHPAPNALSSLVNPE
jgi:hypothetical protein